MPPLYALNPPVHPFWAFVEGLEDHPFFAGPPGTNHNNSKPPPPHAEPAWASKKREQPQDEPEMSEKARGKQATVEDPPEADISSVKPDETREQDLPFRGFGRRRFAREAAREAAREGTDEEGGRRCRRGRRDRGFGPWGGPPFGPPHWHDHSSRPGPPHGLPHEHPHGHRHGPPHGPPHGFPPHHRGPHRRPLSPRHPRSDFNLGEFLNSLGERLGVDLNGAAEGLGLTADRFAASRTTNEVDFEPHADIFENKDLYTIHLSLPGAKKSDVGVDYDGEHSILRVTGVVHRPDADEQMLSELVVDGRKRETGVFEKAIRLGTKRDPAMINVAAISAKMADGILVVKVPKLPKSTERREISISADSSDAEQADYVEDYSAKPAIFDAEEENRELIDKDDDVPTKGEISLLDAEAADKEKDTEQEAKKEQKEGAAKADTAVKRGHTQAEQLPAYSAEAKRDEEDWENFSDASGEAEYVKINVN